MTESSRIWVDWTHVGRRSSGLERVTSELFNEVELAPLHVEKVTAGEGRLAILAGQMIKLPLLGMRHSSDVFVFPGFPPSPYFSKTPQRSVLYVHDLFLIDRTEDLNGAARNYMAPLFKIAIKNFKYFLTNSEDTAARLRKECQPNATIIPFRPTVRNVFELSNENSGSRDPTKFRVVTIGTVEPRKNFVAAADICSALASLLGLTIELHIIGRPGWGGVVDQLAGRPNVILHGFMEKDQVRQIIEQSDLYLCTSHAEGLGLPLLEVQYAGIPVVAPDAAVFREVLGHSGIFIDPASPPSGAEKIAQFVGMADWRTLARSAADENINRWNTVAASDRGGVVSFLQGLTSVH